MNRAVSGMLAVEESGRPLTGLRVVAARLVAGELELLGVALSGDYGRFRVEYPPLCEPADLVLLVFSEEGKLMFTGPVHRAIDGAELSVQVSIPQSVLALDLH
jgi:hypothetical protein